MGNGELEVDSKEDLGGGLVLLVDSSLNELGTACRLSEVLRTSGIGGGRGATRAADEAEACCWVRESASRVAVSSSSRMEEGANVGEVA